MAAELYSAAMSVHTLKTPRLILRPWREEDFDAFADLMADREVTRFLMGPLDRAASDVAAARLKEQVERLGYGFWALEVPGVAPFIGLTGLLPVAFDAPFTPAVELGWRIARAHWGRGYVSEAARAAVDFGFQELGLDELVAFTVPANTRSRAVMKRIGMTHDEADDFDHPRVPDGHPLKRHVLYRIGRP
jgi:ribosomal-protein-alanine N-acetyltransferase